MWLFDRDAYEEQTEIFFAWERMECLRAARITRCICLDRKIPVGARGTMLSWGETFGNVNLGELTISDLIELSLLSL